MPLCTGALDIVDASGGQHAPRWGGVEGCARGGATLGTGQRTDDVGGGGGVPSLTLTLPPWPVAVGVACSIFRLPWRVVANRG